MAIVLKEGEAGPWSHGAATDVESVARREFFKEFVKVQGAMGALKPDSLNPHFSSKYASLQAVMEAVGPFHEAGFSFHHEGFFADSKCFLRTVMVRGDYEIVSIAPLTDDGNPQHFQSSQTYAKRGNILNLTGLALDVDDDANAASGEKIIAREPASYTAKKEAEKKAIAPAESEMAKFTPSKVVFVDGKGKGAGKTFCEIIGPDGTKYSGNEMQGQLAESARGKNQEITVFFKRNGIYNNISSSGVKVPAQTEDEIIEEVGF